MSKASVMTWLEESVDDFDINKKILLLDLMIDNYVHMPAGDMKHMKEVREDLIIEKILLVDD